MNESDQRELDQLKQRQKLIEQQLAALASDLRRIEVRTALSATQTTAAESGPVAASRSAHLF